MAGKKKATRSKLVRPSTPEASALRSLPIDPGAWVVGTRPLGVPMTVSGGLVEPRAFLCVSPEGLAGAGVLDPEGAPDEIAALVQQAMLMPAVGRPRRPRVIRVDDEALATLLRERLGSVVDVVIARDPELDQVFDALLADLADAVRGEATRGPDFSYLGMGGVRPEDLRHFLAAAARLHRAAPWRTLLDREVFRVDVPGLGQEGLCVSIMGAAEQVFGFAVFASRKDFETFGAGTLPGVKSMAVDFMTRGQLPALEAEVAAHGWDVEAAGAVPMIMQIDEGRESHPPERDDLLLATELCAIIADATEMARLASRDRWPVDFARPPVAAGGTPVRLVAPYPRAAAPREPSDPNGKGPPKTTADALAKVLYGHWFKDFHRECADEIEAAFDDIAAVWDEVDERHVGSLPMVWAALWRPRSAGPRQGDVLRKRPYAKAPVVRAAVDRALRGRGAFVEVLHQDAEDYLHLRDLADHTIYRARRPPGPEHSRWMRAVTWLIEVGDGTWWIPSLVHSHTSLKHLELPQLLAEFRAGLAKLGVDEGEGRFLDTSPHEAFARWAGVLLGAVNQLLPTIERPERPRYAINGAGERFELHTARLTWTRAIVDRMWPRLATALGPVDIDDSFVTVLDGAPRGASKKQWIRATIERKSGGVVELVVSSREAFERFKALLTEAAGGVPPEVSVEFSRPWEATPGFVERPGEGVENVTLDRSKIEARGGGVPTAIDAYLDLLDEDVPALGASPRALVAAKQGERVEQWIRTLEVSSAGRGFTDLDPLREALGLESVGRILASGRAPSPTRLG